MHTIAVATASAQQGGINVIKAVHLGCGGEAVVTLKTQLLSHVDAFKMCKPCMRSAIEG